MTTERVSIGRATFAATAFESLCWQGELSNGGGAVHILMGSAMTIEFVSCGFHDLVAGGDGGAVYVNWQVNFCFTGCEFTNVKSGGNGGAVTSEQALTCLVQNCVFNDLKADGFGATFYLKMNSNEPVFRVIDTKFSKCISISFNPEGSICHCTMSKAGAEGADSFRFENCEFTDTDQADEMKTGIQCAWSANSLAEMKIKNCTFDLARPFSTAALYLQSKGPVIIEETVFKKINGGGWLNSYERSKLDVRDSQFIEVKGEQDGIAIDTQDITAVNLDNVTFSRCSTTMSTLGGVVLVRSSTQSCTVNECRFIGNSCMSEAQSLRVVLPSAVVISGCTFSSHTGAVPVLKVEGQLETDDFTLTDCHFKDNTLDENAGLIVFPVGKTTQCKGCWFWNNQGTITTNWGQVAAFEDCRFRVSFSNDQQTHTPVKQESGATEFTFLKCVFVHGGTVPNDAVGIFLSVTDAATLNVTECCFETDQTTSISGGQQTVKDTNFSSSDCIIEPDDPPEPPIVVTTDIDYTQSGIGPDEGDSSELDPTRDDSSESPNKNPTGAIVGGVIGALVVVAVVVLLIYFLVLKRRMDTHKKLSESSGETASEI